MSQVINAYRELCTKCAPNTVSTQVGELEVRQLDQINTVASRYMLLQESEMLRNRLAFIVDDAVDGKEWNWFEIRPGVVQSRATGGLSKFDCGRDSQQVRTKMHKKRQSTERIYIDREICNTELIGSMFQDGQGGMPAYFRSGDSLETIRQSRGYVDDIMVADFHAMAMGIDGTNILGNFNKPGAGSLDTTGNMYPHWDGILKQISQNAAATYYHAVEVTLPAIDGGALFLKYNGQVSASVASHAALVTAINALTRDVDGKQPYSATLIGSVVRIIANEPTGLAYSESDLLVYYAADGNWASCDDALKGTAISPAMPYHEDPLLFDYTAITEANFLSYFKGVIKEHMTRLLDRYNGRPPQFNREYIAIDPLILNEWEYAVLAELKANFNGTEYAQTLNNLFPEFVPLQVLKGTGLFYMTHQANIAYLTNARDISLRPTGSYYDPKCGTVSTRIETVGNVLPLDMSLIASNVKGSPFESALTAPYQPENLPHLQKPIRIDAATNWNQYTDDATMPRAEISYVTNGADDTDLNLVSTSIVADGDSIATYDWTIYLAGAAAVEPDADNVQSATASTLTDAQFNAITHVQLTITTTSGDTETVIVPVNDFVDVTP